MASSGQVVASHIDCYFLLFGFGLFADTIQCIPYYHKSTLRHSPSPHIVVRICHHLLLFCVLPFCKTVSAKRTHHHKPLDYLFIIHRTSILPPLGRLWYKSIYALNIGFTYAYYEDDIKVFIRRHPLAIAGCTIGLFTTLVLMWFFNSYIFVTNVPLWKSIVYYATPLFTIGATYLFGAIPSPLLKFLGKISYEVYLTQGAFVTLFSSMRDNWILYFISVYCFSIFFAWLLHKLCSKSVLTLYRANNL